MDRKSFLELCELYLKTHNIREVDRQNIYNSIVDLYDSTIPSLGNEDDATVLIGEPKVLVNTFVTKFLESSDFDDDEEFEEYYEPSHKEQNRRVRREDDYYRRRPNGLLVFLKICFLVFILICLAPFVIGWFGTLFGLFFTASIGLFAPLFYLGWLLFDSSGFIWFFFFLSLICSGISFMAFYVLSFFAKYSFKACTKFFTFFRS